MENIIDLKDLYNHLESDLHVCRYPSDLIQAIKIFRDKMLKEDNLKIAKIAQIELEALSYSLKNGIVEPFYILKDKDGVDIEFPKLSEYSEEYLDYLSSRMNASANPPLKSRYAHILWCSKRKHGLFAKTALESYIKSLESYIDECIASGIGEKEIVSIIKNIYYISKNLKDKEILLFIKVSIHKLMPIFDVRHRLHFNLWVPLVEMMLEERSIFKRNDLIGINTLYFITGDYQRKIGNLSYAISLFSLGRRVEDRMGIATFRWSEHLAECYEQLMVLSRDNLVALMYCHDAIEYYKKSKNVKQLKRMEAKYSELKSSMALNCSKFNFDMSDILKFCSELTEDLLTKEANYIISYLINSPHLLPRYQFMDQMAVDQLNQFAFISLFPETIIDDRGHIVEHVSTNKEKRYHQILFNYNVAIDMNTIPMVNSILLEAVRNNKLTLDSLLHYFKENTWFGKNINRNLPNNTTYTYNWINFLVPSLHEYFLQLNYYFNSGKYPNFILSIDSLSPKLEGILRDLCEFLEIETFKFTKDKNNRRIALEKDITILLHEDKIREFIGEDDLLFYKYLLVEQSGLKLRHQIAHQLIKYEEYNLNTMNLLILALLRLGKYDFVK